VYMHLEYDITQAWPGV